MFAVLVLALAKQRKRFPHSTSISVYSLIIGHIFHSTYLTPVLLCLCLVVVLRFYKTELVILFQEQIVIQTLVT